MTIENCSNCGGTHYGSHKCPYEDRNVRDEKIAKTIDKHEGIGHGATMGHFLHNNGGEFRKDCKSCRDEKELIALKQKLIEIEENIKVALRIARDDNIVCREGGGPEDLAGSLALTIGRMRHRITTLQDQRSNDDTLIGKITTSEMELQEEIDILKGLKLPKPVIGFGILNPRQRESIMTGNNEFRLNKSTMNKAVQMYMDSLFKAGASPEVLSVEKQSDTMFAIKVKEREEVGKAEEDDGDD